MPEDEVPSINTPLTKNNSQIYRGRFAPSPTGPLHFGSLITAVGSYLQARNQGGEWLVRMEDIDPPREQPGAADAILRALEAYQLDWDGPVRYQSDRSEAYIAALDQLQKQGDSFPCSCSRRSIAEANQHSKANYKNKHMSMIYPGTCRTGLPDGTTARTVRVRVPAETDRFFDTLQGKVETPLQTMVGDFVVKRADGLFAYHLAVIVDDADQNISEIVRGSDLLSSTPPQRHLQACLGYSPPTYCHLPIVTNTRGQKLSKQTYAAAIDVKNPTPVLIKALTFLGQQPDSKLVDATPADILTWATSHWDIQKVPHQASIAIHDYD